MIHSPCEVHLNLVKQSQKNRRCQAPFFPCQQLVTAGLRALSLEKLCHSAHHQRKRQSQSPVSHQIRLCILSLNKNFGKGTNLEHEDSVSLVHSGGSVYDKKRGAWNPCGQGLFTVLYQISTQTFFAFSLCPFRFVGFLNLLQQNEVLVFHKVQSLIRMSYIHLEWCPVMSMFGQLPYSIISNWLSKLFPQATGFQKWP